MGLRAQLLRVVLGDLPDSESVLTEPSPRWDALLGGRTGPDSWSQYGRGFGTTCIVVLNNWAADAGFPSDMIVTEPTPAGGGTRMLRAYTEGARSRGWLKFPARGELPDLKPGYTFRLNRVTNDGSDGSHVGVVVRIVSRTPDSLQVETADGGQGSRQDQKATRQIRTFTLSSGVHPVLVSSALGSGWLEEWVAVGGDEPDEEVDDNGLSIRSSEGSAGAIVAGLAVAGVAFLLFGLTMYSKPFDPDELILKGEYK